MICLGVDLFSGAMYVSETGSRGCVSQLGTRQVPYNWLAGWSIRPATHHSPGSTIESNINRSGWILNETYTSHHITSHHITSHHITSHHITSHHITSHHITSHHITSHHITSHHITSHHITSHHITSHHITSHHITSHHITSHHITHRISSNLPILKQLIELDGKSSFAIGCCWSWRLECLFRYFYLDFWKPPSDWKCVLYFIYQDLPVWMPNGS